MTFLARLISRENISGMHNPNKLSSLNKGKGSKSVVRCCLIKEGGRRNEKDNNEEDGELEKFWGLEVEVRNWEMETVEEDGRTIVKW